MPIRLSAIFADLVSNLESALDLLVAQLVIASGNEISTGNYIPIATSEARWGILRPEKLKGVKDAWAEIIKRTQPLQDEPNASRHALVLLHEANRINKHTLLVPTVLSAAEWQPTFQLNRNALPTDDLVTEPSPHDIGTRIGNGYVIGRARVTSLNNDLRITGFADPNIPGNISVGFLGFPEGGTGADRLPDFVGYVMGVLQPFEEIVAADGKAG